jgi:hypothetical protein
MLVWLARLVARLPLRWSQALGGVLGRLALALSSGFRRKSADNLALAGLLDDARLRRSAEEAGRAAGETPFVWFGDDARVEALIRVEGQEVLDRARAAGRGVILLTPHLGCFEAAARAVARSGPITVLYKPPRLPAVRRLVETGRASPGVRPVPASGAVRGAAGPMSLTPDSWPRLVAGIELGGAARQLAAHCAFVGREGGLLRLRLDPAQQLLRTPALVERLAQALSRHLGEPVRVEVDLGQAVLDTPARQEQQQAQQELSAARESLESDPAVLALQERFGASLKPESVRPNR